MATLIGKTLGKYKLTELLGRGGMAEVYKARHPQLDRHVTIKVLHSYLAEGEDFLARFKREARAVATLRHTHIVQIHDFDVQDETYYMVMEFIDEGTLQARMARLAEAGAYMPVGQVLSILQQVADALDYAHRQGIIHRDIKPSNILLGSSGDAYLSDFGIARMLSTTQFTATGALIGTPTYMSPEQALGEELTDASDIYSLGVILFELLTGKAPFVSDTTPLAVIHKHIHEPPPRPSSLRSELAGELEAVILKALAKVPRERYQSAREMARALEKALSLQSPEKLDGRAEPGSSLVAALPTQRMQEAAEPDRAHLPTEIMGKQIEAGLVPPRPPAEISELEVAEPEEQEAERRNELAAMYAEAVQLLREENYRGALGRWQEIRSIDPKYLDRQKVQRTAKKGLAAQARPVAGKRSIAIPKLLWIGLGGIVTIAAVILAIYLFGESNGKASPSGGSVVLPTATKTPVKTSTPKPTATRPAPTATIDADPSVYDNFNNPAYDGKFNPAQWGYETRNSKGEVFQEDGVLVFTQAGISQTTNLRALHYWEIRINEPMYFEARLKVDMTRNGFIVLQLWGDVIEAGSCGLHSMSDSAYAHCWTRTEDPGYPVGHGTWHTVRIEVDTDENMSTFFIDGKQLAVDRYERPIRGSLIWLSVQAHAGPDRIEDTRAVKGYVDDVRVGPLK